MRGYGRLQKYLALSILFISISSIAFAQSEQKIGIGYVNLSEAFDQYQKTKDFDRALEKRGEVKQGQREKLVEDIRKMREELELLNESSKKKKEEDIEANIKSLQEFDQDVKSELTKERDDMVRDILKEMNDVIQEYGSKRGYSIILNDRVLLYGDPKMDLTGEIIKILNDRYKK